MPLETLDQTARKGKFPYVRLTSPFCRIAHIRQEGPVRLCPCNPTVLDVFTNFFKQRA